ncbi:MAG: hypothetical protein AB2A00_08500 [Myxococcota bacterium]
MKRSMKLSSEPVLAGLGLITAVLLERGAALTEQDWMRALAVLVGLGAGMLVGMMVAERIEQ